MKLTNIPRRPRAPDRFGLRSLIAGVALLAGLWNAPAAQAQTFVPKTFSVVSPAATLDGVVAPVDATVTFSVTGTQLCATLTNNRSVNFRAEVLTGVRFKANTSVAAFSRDSASKGSSILIDADGNPTTNPESEAQHWAYASLGGQKHVLGAAGGTGVGDPDVFQAGGSPPTIDGVDWGLVAGISSPLSASAGPLIRNSMTFKLGGLPNNLDFDISEVEFLYGSNGIPVPATDRSDTLLVPEGPSVMMFAFGLLPMVGMLRRRFTA